MNKKVVKIFLLVFVLLILLISVNFVSAQTSLAEGTQKIGTEISEAVAPILRFLFNVQEDSSVRGISQTILSFIFAFIIVFVFLQLALNKIPLIEEHPGLSKVIIIAGSILAVRGIAQLDVIEQIFMPYSVAALAIINGAIIIGWFILINIGLKGEQFNFIRRVMWILFAVTFVGVWWTRRGELGALLNWIYIATFIFSFIMALIDGTIKGFFAKMEADKLNNINKTKLRAELKKQLQEYQEMNRDNVLSDEDYKTLEKRIQDQARIYHFKKLI